MSPRDPRRTLLLLAGCAFAVAAGCRKIADKGPGFPVSGKVAVEGESLRTGFVLFLPDASRGNKSAVRPAGQIDETGTYTLSAEGKSNIPPGWYKAVVEAFGPAPTGGKGGHSSRARGRSVVNPIYGKAATSRLSVEVVERPSAGAYDLHLKR